MNFSERDNKKHQPELRIVKKWSRNRLYFLAVLIGCLYFPDNLYPQDPLRFKEEITRLKQKNDSLWNPEDAVMIFTGSSSIRMWTDLTHRFPGKPILNSGFGGSQASDLLYYLQPLVLDYQPGKVFIYEGDNDLAEGKSPRKVLKTLKGISDQIHGKHPGIHLVFISAKPSLTRWNMRGKYRRFNRKLERWTGRNDALFFANVWDPMLRDHSLDETLFDEDGLHMNDAGYDIWHDVLQPLIELK